jgi:hypothetical protein
VIGEGHQAEGEKGRKGDSVCAKKLGKGGSDVMKQHGNLS